MFKTFAAPTPNPKVEIAVIAVISLIIRLFKSTAISVWHNEGVSVAISSLSWIEFAKRSITEPFSTPYYLLLKFWTIVFGHGTFSLRFFSIILGTLVAIALYYFIRRIFNDSKIGMLAGVMAAVSPIFLQFSQSAETQIFNLLLSIISVIFLLRALSADTLKSWLVYSLTTTAMIYSEPSLILVFFIQAGYILFNRITNWHKVLGISAPFALILPVIKPLITYFQELPYSLPNASRLLDISWQTIFGGYGTNRVLEFFIILTALFILAVFYTRTKESKKTLVTTILSVSFIFGIISFPRVDSTFPILLLLAGAMLYGIFASVIMHTPNRTLRQIFIITFVTFCIGVVYKNWSDLDIKNKPGMRGAMTYINDNARSQDYLFAANPRLYYSLKFYNETGIFPRLFAPDHKNFPGQELLSELETEADFAIANSNDNAWVVWSRGFDGSKPVVPGNWELINERFYPDAPDYKGQVVISYYHVK